MKTIRIASLSLLTLLLIPSCYWDIDYTVVGTGDVEQMEVDVSEFSGVSVTGTCDVDIVTGEPQKVVLSAQRQVLDVMTYRVRDGVLQIGYKSGYNVKTDSKISADIVVPALDYAGISGAADYTISGERQPVLDIYIEGTGDVNAFDMEVDDCTIRISGAGNCEVRVNNSLDIQVSGVGNVYYIGNPELTSDISGVGNVVAVND
jgi:hypothetical protein